MAEDKEKTLQAAQKYVDKRQYDKAIREYQKILQSNPDDLRVMLRMVPCYENLGNNAEAGSICQKIGCQYRADGAYQKALAAFKQAQRFLPDSDEIAIGMAELYNALGLQHEAVNQLEACLERYQNAQDSENYVRILQMMVRVDSENVPTRIQYAQYLVRAGDLDGAARQYTLALAQLLSKERYVDYIQTARDYLKLSPKDSDVLVNLARIYIKMNRFGDAVVFLSTLAPEDRTPDVRELLVNCYIKLHREREAVLELKALARQYEQEGNRQDIIEDVWHRAQKLAPDDSEVNAALNNDPPMLSESALNVITPDSPSEPSYAQYAQSHVSSVSGMGDPGNERVIRSRMSQAEWYYKSGSLPEARQLCLQVIDLDEQYLPALNMLLEIYRTTGDKLSLAQCERKIAKAVFDESPEDAARHILNAERYTPGAWENYNLMQVLGLDPARYGLRPPVASSPSRPISRLGVPPIPSKLPGVKPSVPPPVPKPGGAVPMTTRKLVRTIEIPEPIQSIPGDVLDELKTLEQSQVPKSMFKPNGQNSGVFPRPPSKTDAMRVQRAVEITDDSNLNGISSIGRAVSNDLDDAFQNMFTGAPKATPSGIKPVEVPLSVPKPQGIPEDDRQKVMDAIQEIDFYASLMLTEDAEKMLNGLIEKYGDVDIIHEAKLRLGM